MSITALYNKLKKRKYDVERVTVYNVDGSGKDADGIIVRHNYSGLYPTQETMKVHSSIVNAARQAGFTAKSRGHYTATLIYKKEIAV